MWHLSQSLLSFLQLQTAGETSHLPHLQEYDYSTVSYCPYGGSGVGPTLVLSHLCYADFIIYFVCHTLSHHCSRCDEGREVTPCVYKEEDDPRWTLNWSVCLARPGDRKLLTIISTCVHHSVSQCSGGAFNLQTEGWQSGKNWPDIRRRRRTATEGSVIKLGGIIWVTRKFWCDVRWCCSVVMYCDNLQQTSGCPLSSQLTLWHKTMFTTSTASTTNITGRHYSNLVVSAATYVDSTLTRPSPKSRNRPWLMLIRAILSTSWFDETMDETWDKPLAVYYCQFSIVLTNWGNTLICEDCFLITFTFSSTINTILCSETEVMVGPGGQRLAIISNTGDSSEQERISYLF